MAVVYNRAMVRREQTPAYSVWGASGALFFVAWLSPALWWLCIPATVLFLYAAKSAPHAVNALWGSWIAGTLKVGGATLWFFSMYPLTWSGIHAPFVQVLIISVYWLGVAAALGFGMVLPGVGMFFLHRYERVSLSVFPILFTAGEVLGSWCFSLYSLGEGSVPSLHFGFGYVGFLIAGLHVVTPVAALAGVYGLSAAVALMSTTLFVSLRYAPARWHVLGGSLITFCILAVITVSYIAPRTAQDIGVTVTAIETNFASESSEEGSDLAATKAAAVRTAVDAAVHTRADYILLPEDARLTEAYDTPAATLSALRELTSKGTVIDTSRWTDERGRTVLRAFYYDLAANRVYAADKQYLVPQGEFVPYLILLLAGRSEILAHIAQDQNYVRGAAREDVTLPATYPGLLFCSEGVSPYLARSISSTRTIPLILHPVSHARFHDSALLARELDAMLRVSAMWSNRTIVSAGNMATGKAYRPDGTTQYGVVTAEHPQWRLVEYTL
jgi:apolipoprotein N-acyltransferase